MSHQVCLFWRHKVHSWLQGQSVGLSIEDDLDVSTGRTSNAQCRILLYNRCQNPLCTDTTQSSLSSVAKYQPLQEEYVLAPYLLAVKGFRATTY